MSEKKIKLRDMTFADVVDIISDIIDERGLSEDKAMDVLALSMIDISTFVVDEDNGDADGYVDIVNIVNENI